MEEELDSSEEGEVSNEEASNESSAFQQHEHMADLFTTSCLDELDYDESVDESENDDHAHPPSHWELRIRRESEQVVEHVAAEEGEIMSDEEGEIKGQFLFQVVSYNYNNDPVATCSLFAQHFLLCSFSWLDAKFSFALLRL